MNHRLKAPALLAVSALALAGSATAPPAPDVDAIRYDPPPFPWTAVSDCVKAGGRGDGRGAAAGTTAAASGGRSRAPPVRGLVDHRLVRLGVGHVGSFLVHAGSVGCQVPGRCQMTPPCGLSAATRPASRGSRQASPRRCLVHAESELNVSWQPAQWQRPAPPHRAPQECVLSISGPSMTRPAPRASRNGPAALRFWPRWARRPQAVERPSDFFCVSESGLLRATRR